MPPLKKPNEPKMNLDHRNYGAWYLHPTQWDQRFQRLSDPKSIEIVKSRNISKVENQGKLAKQDTAPKKVKQHYL